MFREAIFLAEVGVHTLKKNFHCTYTDFAVLFCENSRRARIPIHRRMQLWTAEADRFRERGNFLNDFQGAHRC